MNYEWLSVLLKHFSSKKVLMQSHLSIKSLKSKFFHNWKNYQNVLIQIKTNTARSNSILFFMNIFYFITSSDVALMVLSDGPRFLLCQIPPK